MLNRITFSTHSQLPLIHVVNEDDELLSNNCDAQWYSVLKIFPWEKYRELGASYYNALYDFNISKQLKDENLKENKETKDEGRQRLLFNRTTMDKSKSVLHEMNSKPIAVPLVSPQSISPGVVPKRLGGKKPKCFFALFKSFTGACLMGFAPEPEVVHNLLTSNLSFARVCGFIPNNIDERYWYKSIPSLRKIEQFDQIMTEYGLWNQNKWEEVRRNIELGIIRKENELVGDTTHYHAYSGFETVVYTDPKGKEKKKSQSKVSKKCRCEDPENCPHPWQLADDGAGTIVKSNGKMIWGHKASVLGLPRQGVALDATAVADAATFDGETLLPHVEMLFENLPEVKPWIDRVLYDSACDNGKLKDTFMDRFGIELKASFNPRRTKSVTENLPVGMAKITASGNLICNGGFEMDYKGARFDFEKFIYQAPFDANKVSVCSGCLHQLFCSPQSTKGRVVTISFDMLPSIDSNDPPMAKRFKAIMMRRPAVERMIKRLKRDLSDDRLRKRGNDSFQAYLDKTLIAYHMLLRS
jgi:hypothetical protein